MYAANVGKTMNRRVSELAESRHVAINATATAALKLKCRQPSLVCREDVAFRPPKTIITHLFHSARGRFGTISS